MDSAWSSLTFYESVDLLKRRYHALHGGTLNTSKAVEISSQFAQGREYFASARDAGPLVRPLLLYYGVLALSRGLVLFLEPAFRESALMKAHGLTAAGWDAVLSPRRNDFLSLRVRFTHGTLEQLLAATKNRETVSVNCDTIFDTATLHQNWPAPPQDFEVTLRDIVGRLPDLHQAYSAAVAEQPMSYLGDVLLRRPPTHTDVAFFDTGHGLLSEEEIRLRFDLPAEAQFGTNHSQLGVGRKHCYIRIEHPGGLGTVRLPPMVSNIGGFVYLVPPTGDTSLNSVSSMFVLAYIIGMLVRYWPTQWRGLAAPGGGDAVAPLLNASVRSVEASFPMLVLKHLE